MLTWKGVGYTPEFTRVFDIAMDIIKAGTARIEVVEGIDDVCRTLHPAETPNYHCQSHTIAQRDVTALHDIRQNVGIPVQINTIFPVTLRLLGGFQRKFKSGATRRGCASCQFNVFCTDIAAENFEGTRLGLGAPRP